MKASSEPVVRWRNPARRGPFTPLVVFLHGRGADETDLLDCADVLPPEFAYASVRAPIPLDGGGYTWFESRSPARPIPASLRSAVGEFRNWVDGAPAAGYNAARTYLFGFSAGMMMAGALVLDDPSRFRGAALLSGALPFDAGISAAPGRLDGLPVFYGRGVFDDVIPSDLVLRTQTYLSGASGAALTQREYPHAHAISSRELADIAEWLETLG